VTILEEALKEAFGLGPVFNSLILRLLGMKFVVIVTIIIDTILYLISNYNSKGTLSRDSSKLNLSHSTNTNILGYKYLYAKKIIDKILL